ncbi:hypothetical protein DB31_2777 [Hyalangium minutum]|uniref:Uncharacterized protein n=1 Tax=Hyalangium minutum TaxID=394096 RepID=A0A085W671_9BACT|nr:hypothetical protein DB31_2777 [Hyalangium minutum]
MRRSPCSPRGSSGAARAGRGRRSFGHLGSALSLTRLGWSKSLRVPPQANGGANSEAFSGHFTHCPGGVCWPGERRGSACDSPKRCVPRRDKWTRPV